MTADVVMKPRQARVGWKLLSFQSWPGAGNHAGSHQAASARVVRLTVEVTLLVISCIHIPQHKLLFTCTASALSELWCHGLDETNRAATNILTKIRNFKDLRTCRKWLKGTKKGPKLRLIRNRMSRQTTLWSLITICLLYTSPSPRD